MFLEVVIELLMDGLSAASEDFLKSEKFKKNKKSWWRLALVGLCWLIQLGFAILFAFLAWMLVQKLLLSQKSNLSLTFILIPLMILVSGVFFWRSWKLSKLIYRAFHN